jgi:hypothetical protein
MLSQLGLIDFNNTKKKRDNYQIQRTINTERELEVLERATCRNLVKKIQE